MWAIIVLFSFHMIALGIALSKHGEPRKENYSFFRTFLSNVLLASFSKSHLNFHRDIEYTRTDALIEKAWDWIENNILSSNQQDKSLLYYEQFKNFIKGK